jgi:hypothetical protein
MQQGRKHGERLTYANVMATIAVFIALGSGAYAASQLPRNSVGPRQLRKNAVTKAKVKKNAISTSKIVRNAVTGAKVKESTLGRVPDASALGGFPASAYAAAPMWALVDNTGTILRQSGGIGSNTIGIGRVDIAFPGSLSGRAVSATRALVGNDPLNSVGVEVGICAVELSCGEFGVPDDGTHATVVTTGLNAELVVNEAHSFWIVAH